MSNKALFILTDMRNKTLGARVMLDNKVYNLSTNTLEKFNKTEQIINNSLFGIIYECLSITIKNKSTGIIKKDILDKYINIVEEE